MPATATVSSCALLCASYVLPYLICGIPFALIISRLCAGVDIRTRGSGNVGSTNALRELGLRWGVLTFVLDCGKGMISCLLVIALSRASHGGFTLNTTHLLACVIGHIFSIYLKGKGGKGIATGLGAGLVVCPIPTLIALFIFICVVSCTRYVSLGSIMAACVLPLSYTIITWPPAHYAAVAIIATGAVVLWAHRTNISKLYHGKESKLGHTS